MNIISYCFLYYIVCTRQNVSSLWPKVRHSCRLGDDRCLFNICIYIKEKSGVLDGQFHSYLTLSMNFQTLLLISGELAAWTVEAHHINDTNSLLKYFGINYRKFLIQPLLLNRCIWTVFDKVHMRSSYY